MALGFEGTLNVGIGLLLGLALLKYSGYVELIKKELSYIASGAVFLLLGAVIRTAEGITGIGAAVKWIELIFIVIAFILVLIGAITMAFQIFSKIK
jgi:hypothetical protein